VRRNDFCEDLVKGKIVSSLTESTQKSFLRTQRRINKTLKSRPDRICSKKSQLSGPCHWYITIRRGDRPCGTLGIYLLCGLHTSSHRERKRPKHSFSSFEIYSWMCSAAFSQVKHSPSWLLFSVRQGRGVSGCVGDHIMHDLYTLSGTRFKVYKVAWLPPTRKKLRRAGGPRQLNSYRKAFFRYFKDEEILQCLHESCPSTLHPRQISRRAPTSDPCTDP
jgi:hypothetical protein